MPTSTFIDFVPGVGKRTAQILHNMGVHTVGQLEHIPDGVLEHIFGPSIHSVLDVARTRHAFSSQTQVHNTVTLPWWKKFQLAARVVSVL